MHKCFTEMSKFKVSERPTICCAFLKIQHTIYSMLTKVSKTFVEGSSPSAPAKNFVQSAAIGLHIFVLVIQSPFAFLPMHLRINGCRYCMLLQHPRVQAVLTKS